MSPKLKKGIRWAISAAILVFLILFARTIDWHAAWNSMRHASLPLLAAAIGVNVLSVIIKAIRWWLFLRPAGITSLPLAIRATIAGAGLNNILVASGGDAARVVFVSRSTGVSSSTVLATMALERLFDPIGFVFLLVFGVLVFQLPAQFEAWKTPAEILLVVIVVVLAFFVYATRRMKPEHVPERRAKPRTLKERIRVYFVTFGKTAGRLATGPRFVAAIILSLASWACQLWTFELAAAAAHVDMPLAGSLACLLAINVGLILRATPGNVGFFQFAYALMAEQFGVPRDDAIAVSLLIQTLQILPMTLLGVAMAPEFILRRGTKDAETETVAQKIEAERASHVGPLSTADEVLKRADKAGVVSET
ncbi:MAG TPA: lysylphosphatidylglycerol synthase transmembrane domain-containing protein [Gemmatimonadaceae bacterium]|jgi:glycosyltransferase 2 family protein|nr:lysylphosphatidylglycerol synthase transmembrane domain-containing protein [Gemmatimonadaceae bacterium]